MQCKWIKKLCRFVGLAATALAAALTIPIQAAEWHVNASVENCGDGEIWETAFKYLQDALNNQFLAAGDQIWVAQGIYFVDQDCANPDGTGDRVSTFELVKDVWLLGGFFGNEMLPEQRDPLTHITILSGALDFGECSPVCGPGAGDCFIPNGSPGCENATCCCLVCAINPGCCDIVEPHWDELCAILASKVCGGAYHVVTAGSEITDSFTTIIDGFTIQDGTAVGGGGVNQNEGGGMLITGQPSVIRCIFTNNNAGGVGGAVSIVGPDIEPQLINCEFRNNPGSQAAVLYETTVHGGGLAIRDSTPTLTNCVFANNEAIIHGGAIFNVAVPGCTPGMDCPALTLFNCTLSGNVADSGDPPDGVGVGGGIYTTVTTQVHLTNSILWGNTDSSPGGETAQIRGPATVTYSDVAGVLWPGIGNINDDPLFVDPASDFHLQAGSRCIDAGNPEETVIPVDQFDINNDGDELEPTPDLDLNDRILPPPPAGIVDMGA